ncbi:tyrosine-type recombinase/integrase [Stackebrandtia soli]|uniref:tyrosine-type recombinase/integrase n=1 Tax=Stackebrandtia soli TaxID=1892856 RepID=UPI0039EBA793
MSHELVNIEGSRETTHRAPADPYLTYLSQLVSPASRREMAACLDRIVRLRTGIDTATGHGQPWHLLRYRDTTDIKALLTDQGWSPAHVNKHLVALRRVLTEAMRLGLMSTDDWKKATDISSVRNVRLPRGRHVPSETSGAVFAVCDADTSPAGRRDAALLAVLMSTGCRRGEVARLALADYDSGERSLTVLGKRDKQRLVHLNKQAVARLELWLAVRGLGPGALFSPIARSGRIRIRDGEPAPMTGQAIANILSRRFEECGAPAATPHDLRRTFIGELLDAGVDLSTAQQIVGHSSPETTARYDRRPGRRRREAIDRLSLPEPGEA